MAALRRSRTNQHAGRVRIGGTRRLRRRFRARDHEPEHLLPVPGPSPRGKLLRDGGALVRLASGFAGALILDFVLRDAPRPRVAVGLLATIVPTGYPAVPRVG